MNDNLAGYWAKKPYTERTFEHSAALLLRIIEDLDVDEFTTEEVQGLGIVEYNTKRRDSPIYGPRHIACLVLQGFVLDLEDGCYALTDEGLIEGRRGS